MNGPYTTSDPRISGALSYAGQGVANCDRPSTVSEINRDSAERLLNAIYQLLSEAREIADAHLGSQPEQNQKEAMSPSPVGIAYQTGNHLDKAHAALELLQGQIGRLRAL